MIKKILECLIASVLRTAFWFRYRIEVKGLENLNSKTLSKPGGVIFLPNHPTVFVDATAIPIALWPKFSLRPLVIDYMYELPIVNPLMHLLDGLPVPNFSETSNSFKRRKNDKVIQAVVEGIKQKQNFLIFPAGRLKQSSYEAIGGNSAVHRIIQDAPEVNVVLVRLKGLYGSSFSRALTGKTPSMVKTILNGIKHVFLNLIFFTPRRKVIIEFEPAPADFPFKGSRLEINQYLEHWYNRPDGLTKQQGAYPGDSLILVPYSMWKNDVPEVMTQTKEIRKEDLALSSVSPEIQKKILTKLAELTAQDPGSIKPEMTLTTDLGMDSLDVADAIAFIQEEFEVSTLSPTDITNVGKLMALAAKQVIAEESKEDEKEMNLSDWQQSRSHDRVQMPEGDTIPEIFLRNCDRMSHAVACADMISGVLTYKQLKLRALLLANYIRTLPGEYIGIMLPASVAASVTILACQLAGKIPLMVNWTVGPRHLQAVVQLSNVQAVLSSWSFLDRLQNVDLTGIEDQIIMLEDVRKKIGLTDKLKAYFRSKLSAKTLLKTLGLQNLTKESRAVLLFTSGTESMPKGVPLTHHNIVTNQRAALKSIEIYSDDIIYGILPPFHSFGFTITSLIPLLTGVRVAYSPDPTDGRCVAKGFSRWGITVVCGAPTFLKGMLKGMTVDDLKTLRLCVAGAEKMPPDLIHLLLDLKKSDTLIEGYGITECSPVLTFTPFGQPLVGVGQPVPGVELCIVDLESHVPLTQGKQGLILTRGPNVFSGYLNPGLASPFLTVNGKQWYNTGDLGFWDAQGNLTLSGRLKRFIKVGGEMVSLASLEEALSHTALKKAWTLPEEGPVLAICAKEIPGDKPKITLFSKFPVTLDDVNRALKEAGFSNLVRVSTVSQLPEIPIMGTGKIHYRKLEELG